MSNLSSHTAPRPRLPVEGDLFAGNYRVLSLLGAGTSSKVYLGLHTGNQRRVALKVFDMAGVEERSVWRERFVQEAELIAELRSTYTVTLYDSGEDPEGRLYQVMEYVPGITIEERVRQEGAFSEIRTVRILRQVLESLKEAHLRGILHRDIKPSNILLFDEMGEVDCVKVLDFGVAKIKGGRHDLTATGTTVGTLHYMSPEQIVGSKAIELVVGTPRYMSPEQLQGGQLGAASDLYSVGLLAVFMMTGEHPFHNPDLAIEAKVMGQIGDLTADVEISPRLKNTINRLLKASASERYPDAAAVIAAIETLAKLPDTHAPTVEIPSGFPMTAEVRGAPTAHYMQTGEATLSMLVKNGASAIIPAKNSETWWPWVLAVVIGIALIAVLLAL